MNKAERKRIAKVYLDAAELIETGHSNFCCWAICFAMIGTESDYERKIFSDLFKIDALELHDQQDPCWAQELDESSDLPHVRARRVLLLVMAAHVIEQGFWP